MTKSFITITNEDIYHKLISLENMNAEQHNAIIRRLDVTNGKVKLSKWIATSAISLSLLAIGFIFSHIGRY